MEFNQLIKPVEPLKVVGPIDFEIKDLVFDSRKVSPNSLFFALRGTIVDGHDFIDKAIKNGATAVVCEQLPSTLEATVTYIQVGDAAESMGQMANVFYDMPSRQTRLVGVTGTNGKTTTVTMLFDLFKGLGYKCGLLSTIQNRIGTTVLQSTHTTPDVVTINALLQEMVDRGCDYVFMEVSSHAVDQRRTAGLHFSVGVFTNMSHDHLDYHKTFAAYIQAKKRFFDDLPKGAFALVNTDDKRGRIMVQNTQAKVKTYSLRSLADFKGRIIENSLLGLQLEINRQELFAQFIGDFNAYNLLAAFGVASLLDQESEAVLRVLSALKAAEGRFDYLRSPDQQTIAIVDYAHTPDALEKVLRTIQKVKPAGANTVTVVGCGGDRDKAKRPEMAKIAVQNSEQVILTSDNPRSEAPDAIIADMEAGLSEDQKLQVLLITDRKQAIKTACRLAKKGDVILVAGKGHEKYQEINGVKYPFDDKEVLKEAFQLD
ncbi:MAG: UDP-N-acetylmuramoyl-L-alanyl-D-glutamate--2,6-diaminopimelate ligase [Bacteroidota bacterium]